MRILVLNGPNLNLLGVREPGIYGNQTYEDLVLFTKTAADELGMEVTILQTNHEGELVDFIQSALGNYDGIVLNAAAYTHTSIAILDALKAVNLKTVEVHLSDISKREPFRQTNYVSLFAHKKIVGKGFLGYREALMWFQNHNID